MCGHLRWIRECSPGTQQPVGLLGFGVRLLKFTSHPTPWCLDLEWVRGEYTTNEYHRVPGQFAEVLGEVPLIHPVLPHLVRWVWVGDQFCRFGVGSNDVPPATDQLG